MLTFALFSCCCESQAWEDEVNELVNEAKSDVDTAVADIEQVGNRGHTYILSITTTGHSAVTLIPRPRCPRSLR